MRHLILFLLIVYLSHSFEYLDFEVGPEYRFGFFVDQTTVESGEETHESYSGILHIKKPEDEWLFCELTYIKSDPESLRDDLSKPFKINGTSFSVTQFQDADGVSKKASKFKEKLMEIILYDYTQYKQLIPKKDVRVEVPFLNLCKINYDKMVREKEIDVTITVDSSDCERLEPGVLSPDESAVLILSMTYNVTDLSITQLILDYITRVGDVLTETRVSKYRCALAFMDSNKISRSN